jgi:hypothetical protein
MTVRIQFDIAEHQWDSMKGLMEKCGTDTCKDFFNNTYALLEWAVREKCAGNVIASINDGAKQVKELDMPCLRKLDAKPYRPQSRRNKVILALSLSVTVLAGMIFPTQADCHEHPVAYRTVLG